MACGLDNALKKPAGGTALAGDNVGVDSVKRRSERCSQRYHHITPAFIYKITHSRDAV